MRYNTLSFLLCLWFISACRASPEVIATQTATAATAIAASRTRTPTSTPRPSATATITPSPTESPTATTLPTSTPVPPTATPQPDQIAAQIGLSGSGYNVQQDVHDPNVQRLLSNDGQIVAVRHNAGGWLTPSLAASEIGLATSKAGYEFSSDALNILLYERDASLKAILDVDGWHNMQVVLEKMVDGTYRFLDLGAWRDGGKVFVSGVSYGISTEPVQMIEPGTSEVIGYSVTTARALYVREYNARHADQSILDTYLIAQKVQVLPNSKEYHLEGGFDQNLVELFDQRLSRGKVFVGWVTVDQDAAVFYHLQLSADYSVQPPAFPKDLEKFLEAYYPIVEAAGVDLWSHQHTNGMLILGTQPQHGVVTIP